MVVIKDCLKNKYFRLSKIGLWKEKFIMRNRMTIFQNAVAVMRVVYIQGRIGGQGLQREL